METGYKIVNLTDEEMGRFYVDGVLPIQARLIIVRSLVQVQPGLPFGRVSEGFKVTVLKTVGVRAPVGSNPTSSANWRIGEVGISMDC